MQSADGAVREAIHSWAERARAAELARATGSGVEEAERLAQRARAALGAGEVRERLEEAVSTRALDERSHGALLAHLARAAEDETLARRGVSLALGADERIVLEDRERTLVELAAELRVAPVAAASRALEALARAAASGRSARLEALAEADERARRVHARGPAAPDAPPQTLREHCAAFLVATDDAAQDLVARAHHAAEPSAEGTLLARVRALGVAPLDPLASARGRGARLGAALAALGLGRELDLRVQTRAGRLLSLAPSVHAGAGRALVVTSPLEAGITSERASLAAVARALILALASPALAIEHAVPTAGSVAAATGALFGALFADPRFVARHLDCGRADATRLARASAAAIVLEARAACVPVVSGTEASEQAARESMARALVLDPGIVAPELARTSRVRASDALTTARARLAALAWAPALRERWDEDYYRNPRIADFLRGAAARGGLASAERISDELGASAAMAAAHVVELAQRAG